MTSQATAAAQHDKLTIKDQLPVILSYLDDARKLIEAGKVRRWEVFKWAFALNLLFASATAAHDKLPISPAVFILASIGTSIMAALLINHYDHRMNGARARARDLTQWLRENVLDVNSVMQEFGRIAIKAKDQHEKALFYSGIFASALAVTFTASLR